MTSLSKVKRSGRVLVIYKKSLYQLYVEEHREPSIARALSRGDAAAEEIAKSHHTQQTALSHVKNVLDKYSLEARFVCRGSLDQQIQEVDLVICVGGDGTVLEAAHRLDNTIALLGLNSDPSSSVGRLCAGPALELERLLAAWDDNTIAAKPLARAKIYLDGVPILGPCLNDILIAHHSPAELSRFDMAIVSADSASPPAWQSVRNSGLWISTATGSTAAIRSAGGSEMDLDSQALQYLVREPYRFREAIESDRRVREQWNSRGLIDVNECFLLRNRMRSGRVWADGVHRQMVLYFGSLLRVERHPHAVHLLLPA